MAITKAETQVKWSTNDSVPVSAGGNQTSDAVTLDATCFRATIHNNPGGGTDPYLDVCRIVAGVADNVRGMLYGAEVKIDDETRLNMTESGDVIVNRLPNRKIIDATVALIDSEIPKMMGIIRRVGAHTPVFVAGAEAYTNDPSRSDLRCYGYIDASGLGLRKIAPFYDQNNFVIRSI